MPERTYHLGSPDPMPAWQARLEQLLGTGDLVYGVGGAVQHAETNAPLGRVQVEDGAVRFRPTGFGEEYIVRGTWPPSEVRAWTERHGGNISALARRLRVPRTQLQAWLADPTETSRARPLPPYIQAAMEMVDRIAELETADR